MQVIVLNAVVTFGDVTVIDSQSLVAASGRLTALAGPSGSGKTTLLAVIAGALRLDGGEVVFAQSGLVVPREAVRIAWISQSANTLPDRSSLDNVAVAGLARGMSVADAQREARMHLAELGLGEKILSPARLLSGGEQQRLSFARALCAEADIILADEPTANLDAGNTAVLCARLQSLSIQRTIIVATHDPQLIAVCDDIVQVGVLPGGIRTSDEIGRQPTQSSR